MLHWLLGRRQQEMPERQLNRELRKRGRELRHLLGAIKSMPGGDLQQHHRHVWLCLQGAAGRLACTSGGKSGQCYNSSSPTCCTGCWDSSSGICKAGTVVSACGMGGYACQKCSALNDCKTATCVANKCGSTNRANKTSCKSGKGKCYSGVCCQYCYSGSYCTSGSGFPMCGSGGNMCTNCTSQKAGTCNASTGVCTCTVTVQPAPPVHLPPLRRTLLASTATRRQPC